MCSTWLVWHFWAQQFRKNGKFSILLKSRFHSPAPFSTTNTYTLRDPHTNTHHRHHPTPPPHLLLFLVINASASPCWPQATSFFIWGKRRESCHIIMQRLCQNSHMLSFSLPTLSLCSLLNANPSSFFFSFSHSFFIFTHRPFSAWNKGRKCPWH